MSDKWKGIKFKSDYRPNQFNHRNNSYKWKELTREQIEQLAKDEKFTLFTLAEITAEKGSGQKRQQMAAAESTTEAKA